MLRRGFACLASLGLDLDVQRLVAKALTVAAPGPSRVLVDAGLEAGLDADASLTRASTAFLNFAAFNLADDLSDGDCDYLPPAEATAVLLILNALFFSSAHCANCDCRRPPSNRSWTSSSGPRRPRCWRSPPAPGMPTGFSG